MCIVALSLSGMFSSGEQPLAACSKALSLCPKVFRQIEQAAKLLPGIQSAGKARKHPNCLSQRKKRQFLIPAMHCQTIGNCQLQLHVTNRAASEVSLSAGIASMSSSPPAALLPGLAGFSSFAGLPTLSISQIARESLPGRPAMQSSALHPHLRFHHIRCLHTALPAG